ITRDRTLINMTEEEWDEVIGVHLKGTFACSKFAAIQMRAQKGGRIINTIASGGLQGGFGRGNYAAAKGGILSLTFTWALELARHNITVNALRPEARTRMTEPLIERAQQAAASGVPDPNIGRRWPEPDEEAPLVVFMASDQASWLNGQILDIDGPRVTVWSRPQPAKSIFMPQGWTPELLIKHLTPDFVKGALS
ncbi:MAG: SDR family oxidoreductase, partial [Chloroflexota bacterium]|nr:SDR family oxidoreductase [Chloroflexota bacterium]